MELKFDCFNLLKIIGNEKSSLLQNKRKFWILPVHVGNSYFIPNGSYLESYVTITQSMIGMKLGQLALTKKKVRHRIRKKKKKKIINGTYCKSYI